MIAGIMEIVAEAHVFAEKSGLEPNILENLIEQNFGQLAFSDSQRMTSGVYIPQAGEFLPYIPRKPTKENRNGQTVRT